VLVVTGTDHPCRNMYTRTHVHYPHWWSAWARAINFSEFHIHEHRPWVTITSESESNNHERICACKHVSDNKREHWRWTWPLVATSKSILGSKRDRERELLAPYSQCTCGEGQDWTGW
jgi:hypothetical protein